ncbi:probable caffeoyl-CoA O-methyltransferase 2 [Dendronephthya gigantea]|uniref:probable caffeoyl-CoA O-methyltransferase 2 n=1 Tax=Dendronephthya gigantea TaxID=151771 RepID=UPI001068E55D|nr:probable caffeoyl-CoA O-methyltransferase 2 [Dendronephthya gigantea]
MATTTSSSYNDKLDDVSKFLFKSRKNVDGFTNPIAAYVMKNSLTEPDILRRLYEKTSAETPRIRMISDAEQCQFLRLLLKLTNAKKAIEIGVFTGYNLLSVAMTIPKDGKVIGCDVSREYFDVGRPLIEEAGVMDKIDLRIQPALQTLDELLAAGEGGTFDFIYIDADKMNYDNYYEKGLQLLRSGGLIAIDNVLWNGRVVKNEKDEETTVIHNLNQKMHKDPRVDNSLLPIGDGLNLAMKI